MSRAIVVRIMAIVLVGLSGWVLLRVVDHPASQRNRPMFIAAGLLVLLALVAGEALWSLRSHAFLVFMVWGLCAMVAVALLGLHSAAGARPVRMMPTMVYAGVAIAGAGLYLKRVV